MGPCWFSSSPGIAAEPCGRLPVMRNCSPEGHHHAQGGAHAQGVGGLSGRCKGRRRRTATRAGPGGVRRTCSQRGGPSTRGWMPDSPPPLAWKILLEEPYRSSTGADCGARPRTFRCGAGTGCGWPTSVAQAPGWPPVGGTGGETAANASQLVRRRDEGLGARSRRCLSLPAAPVPPRRRWAILGMRYTRNGCAVLRIKRQAAAE